MEDYAKAKREFDEAMQKHRAFRRHSKEYYQASQERRAQIANSNEKCAGLEARRQASSRGESGEWDAEAFQAEVEAARQDPLEQQMVYENLQREFADLKDQFAELHSPENDVIELGRKVRKLRPGASR
jgi:hypothetical protein